jgi:outer membrane protein assembly factor BamB
MSEKVLFVGTKGTVTAIDKTNGKEIWRTHLKSSSFVIIALDDDQIYAHTNGELFCLNKKTGKQLWKNGLSGLGYGLATVVINDVQSNMSTIAQQVQAQQAAAANASMVASQQNNNN